MRCVRTRSIFQHSIEAAFVEIHTFVFTMFYVRLSRFLMKYVERISSRTIRIHYETHFESQEKDFARERMFWYRENSHKHVIIVPPLTLSPFFLSYFRFTRLSITMLVVYPLFSFVFLSCIHIHTAINTRALSSTRLFPYHTLAK